MKTSLSIDSVRDTAARLQQANNDFARKYPGEVFRRQPVHTVYGGAHLFKSDSAYAWEHWRVARSISLPLTFLPSRKQLACPGRNA